MEVSLSMLTSSSLPADLKAIKQSLRFPLIRFEDAKVELGKLCCTIIFIQHHHIFKVTILLQYNCIF